MNYSPVMIILANLWWKNGPILCFLMSFHHAIIPLQPCRSRVRYISAVSQLSDQCQCILNYWPWGSMIYPFLTVPSIWVNLRRLYSTEHNRLLWQDDRTIPHLLWLKFCIKLHFGTFSSVMSMWPSLSSDGRLKVHFHLCFQCCWHMSVPPFLLLGLWIERPAPPLGNYHLRYSHIYWGYNCQAQWIWRHQSLYIIRDFTVRQYPATFFRDQLTFLESMVPVYSTDDFVSCYQGGQSLAYCWVTVDPSKFPLTRCILTGHAQCHICQYYCQTSVPPALYSWDCMFFYTAWCLTLTNSQVFPVYCRNCTLPILKPSLVHGANQELEIRILQDNQWILVPPQ